MYDDEGYGVEESLVRSVLRLPEVHDVATDLADRGLNELLDNEALSAIPVIRSVRAMVRGAMGLREALLIKKVLRFLTGLGTVSARDTERWHARVEQNPKEVGERILAVVDRVTALPKAELAGRAFRLYLDGEGDRETFLRTIEMIEGPE